MGSSGRVSIERKDCSFRLLDVHSLVGIIRPTALEELNGSARLASPPASDYNPLIDRTGGATMIQLHEEYLVDEQGHRKAVVVPMEEWLQIKEALEELADIEAYDRAKQRPSDPIPLEQAIGEIEDGDRG